MDLLSQHRIKMLQYEDLLREAEKQRLIKEIKASQAGKLGLVQRLRQQLALHWPPQAERGRRDKAGRANLRVAGEGN